MNAGDVFRFNRIAEIHVWMVISDPARNDQQLLMVNFTTWAPELDQVCIVDMAEHPFITQRSLINFAKAKIVSNSQLERLKTVGALTLLDPLSASLLQRIREAAMNSITLPLECGDVLINQELDN